MRQLALGQESLGQAVVETVEAENDDAFEADISWGTPPEENSQQAAKGPEQYQRQCRQDRTENRQKGTRQRKARAGANVGPGRAGQQDDQQHGGQDDAIADHLSIHYCAINSSSFLPGVKSFPARPA